MYTDSNAPGAPELKLDLGLGDGATYLNDIIETQNDLAAVELDPSVIMRVVAERTQHLAAADGAAVHLMEGPDLVCRAGAGIMAPHDGMKLPMVASLVGLAIRTGRFQYTRDSECDPRVDRLATRKIGLRSLVAVPLTHVRGAIGAVVVASRRTDAFGHQQIAAVRLMAGVVVASLSHAAELNAKKQLLAERTEALSLLRASEQQFRNLFQHASDAVVVHDLEGRLLDANALACKSLGYRYEELLNLTVQDVEADFEVAQVKRRWAQLKAGQPTTINGTHRRRDGSLFPVEVRIILIEHADRPAILAIIRDVSDRRRIEDALRESQERFRSSFEHASIGMALVSLDGRWLQVNPSVCRIVGYTEQELLVRDFQSITHPDDLGADLAYVGQLVSRRIDEYQMVKRYIHRQGHLVWVLLSVSLVKNAVGEPAYFISQIQDITKRQQAEEALLASVAEFRATFEMAGVGKAQTDLITGRFVRVNEKFCQMTGYSASALTGMDFIHLTHPDDAAASQASAQRMLQGLSTEETLEKRYIRQDGQTIWVILNAAVLKDPAGRPVRSICTVQDITERKHSEWLEQDRRRVLEMVALGLPLPDVLNGLIDALERQVPASLGFIMLLHDGEVSLTGPAIPARLMDAMQPQCLSLAARLSSGAWASENVCGATLIDSDEVWEDLRPFALELGVGACWTAAIRSNDGAPLGLLNIFVKRRSPPTAAEAQTLDMCAKLATICIEHHHATGQLSHLVKHDRLTGLPNRLMFEDRIEQAVAMASRSGKHVGLLALDIDKFKAINDSLGHQAGDHLLQQFAQRLQQQLRKSDTMARIGGDEFVVVLPELESLEGAAVVARKLIDSLQAPFECGENIIPASTSIGLAIYPADGDDALSLMKRADAALYRAKRNGRNAFSV